MIVRFFDFLTIITLRGGGQGECDSVYANVSSQECKLTCGVCHQTPSASSRSPVPATRARNMTRLATGPKLQQASVSKIVPARVPQIKHDDMGKGSSKIDVLV